MTATSDLAGRVAALEQIVADQAKTIADILLACRRIVEAVDANATTCNRNFDILTTANNSVVQSLNMTDEADWWKQGGGNDATSDPDIPAAG